MKAARAPHHSVAIIGAGLSGILAGIRLRGAGIEDFVIYESQADVGGTWLRNTYPGLHCDMPSHLYCYSFAPNPEFSLVYAPQPEILAYLRDCARDYRVLEHIRFNTRAESAIYSEADCLWSGGLDTGTEQRHRVLISATGGLTAPHFPRIAGFERFERCYWHAGAWRHDVSLQGKAVAVVGSAASAVQVVPEVARKAARVVVFSRTPNWVTPRQNAAYSSQQKAALRNRSDWTALWRKLYRASMVWHHAFMRHSRATSQLRDATLEHMRTAISDPDLIEALTPHYEPGCKRILRSDDYYSTLAQDHVKLVPHGVREMTATSLVAADGTAHDVDVAIFCTGYKLGGRADGAPALEVIGREGQSMRAALGRVPEAYRGVAVPGFPNYFTICGINGAAGHAPVFLSAEVAVDYIVRWVAKLARGQLRSVEPKSEATRQYSASVQAELQTMSWAGDCPGWYRDRKGRILPFHPGSIGRMRREMREDYVEDFHLA